MQTAVNSLAEFAASVPSRTLFRTPAAVGDMRAMAHNEWTLCLWVLWLRGQVSRKTKRKLKAGSIRSRVSLLVGLLSHRYGFRLVQDPIRLKALIKKLTAADPMAAVRRKRRGIRRRHLRRVWQRAPAVRRTSVVARAEWAAATVAWHVLARGGEMALVQRSDLRFMRDGRGRRYAELWLRPLKKRGGAAQAKVPQYILERPGEEWEPYAALARLSDTLDAAQQPQTAPLFQGGDGRPINASRMRQIARQYARVLGVPPEQVGAHSFRIGGATDLVATGQLSQLLLQAKGRWQSDIGRIYARMTRRAHLAASELMHHARGRDLEELLPTFTQAAG